MALSSNKQRVYRATSLEVVLPMPIKSGATIYEGAALESNNGFVEPVSGAGTFLGFAMHDAVGGASDGLNTVMVRAAGMVELPITSETPAQSDVGASASVVEATDDDTFRIERAATITGTPIGKIVALVSSTVVLVSFKAAHLA